MAAKLLTKVVLEYSNGDKSTFENEAGEQVAQEDLRESRRLIGRHLTTPEKDEK